MYVRIRQFSSHTNDKDILVKVNNDTSIGDIRKIVCERLQVQPVRLKLYHGGKLLIDVHKLSDYKIRPKDVIQLMILSPCHEPDNLGMGIDENSTDDLLVVKSYYYEVGGLVDFLETGNGAWFEAKIMGIYKRNQSEDDLVFRLRMDRGEHTAPFYVEPYRVRPRSHYIYPRAELNEGMLVLANYNTEKPNFRGLWYDFLITHLSPEEVTGTIYCGQTLAPLSLCTIKYDREIMRIEDTIMLTERKPASEQVLPRKLPYYCRRCKDSPRKRCKECGCRICGSKHDPDTLIMCDDCDYAFHLSCLNPPLSGIPNGDWYCPGCKTDDSEIVRPGEKLKEDEISREEVLNNFGPVEGVEVGTCWNTRQELTASGVHKPLTSFVHGDDEQGVYSLILNDSVEENYDNGDEFYFTGFSDNLDQADKIKNIFQHLININRALALNCNTPFIDNGGFGSSSNWRLGNPIRVIRSERMWRFGPTKGYRYDGIYKIVEYFPDLTFQDTIYWRFLLRRDDPTPPPWPPRKQYICFSPNKFQPYFNFYAELKRLIICDDLNKDLWQECKKCLHKGWDCFLQKVKEVFMCICCHDILQEPITMPCKHNICKNCLRRCFTSKVYSCPSCRFVLGKSFRMNPNKNLEIILGFIRFKLV